MPEKIGPYTVVSQLGRGGMGVVYKGRDESLNRFVAIKVLTENLSEDPTFLQRFVREAQAAASLSHPNVIQIYFNGEDNGHPYFVMEYVAGRSLDQVLRSEGRIDNPRASQLILQAAQGLAAAHDIGLIHRDIKPANLMLDERGMVKIADFGLALPAAAETRLTATGMFVGTPGYLSPEQCAGETADHRTDIYALGVTYYLLLTGTPPFRGDSPLALMKQILDANPPDVTTVNPNVDPESRRILAKMIAKEREHRYQSCHELVADLDHLLASMGVRSATASVLPRPTASSPAALAAMSAPTAVTSPVASSNTASAPTAIVPPAAPTAILPPIASSGPTTATAATLPDMHMPGAPTQPAMAVPVTKKGVSTPAILVAALLAFILLGGGAVAAVLYGTNLFRSKGTTTQEAEKGPIVAASAAAVKPNQEALLSQPVTSTTRPAGDQAAPVPVGSPEMAQPATQLTSQPATQPTTQLANGQPAGRPATQVASVRERPAVPAQTAPPARAQSQRARSGVAVAAMGDQALHGAVSNVLRSEAEAAGLDVADAHALPSTEDMLRGGASLRELIAQLRDDGFAVLMLARIEPTGQREISYYGRYDTAYSARVTVTAYDLATGRPFGTPQSGEVRYTSLSIVSESEDVVTPLAQAAARTIRNR